MIIFTEGPQIIMKVIKVGNVAKEPQVDKLFTGPVTMRPIIGPELSKNFLIKKR